MFENGCPFDLGKELEVDIFEEYMIACMTRIVGLAAEECGRSSYHVDQSFSKEDLMDPDFPNNMEQEKRLEEEKRFVTPEDILVDICGKSVEVIVNTIGQMEMCWSTREYSITKENSKVATILWEFVKEHAMHHIESLYDEEYVQEFSRVGESFFGEAQK